MKNLFLFLAISLQLAACDFMEDVFEGEESTCPPVHAELIPIAVLNAFDENFPEDPANVWCDIGNGEYVAAFKNDNVALFNEAGDLLYEGDDDGIEKRGNCECEFEESGGDAKEKLVDRKIIDPDNIDPDNFTDVIDNEYFPLIPGTRFTYQGENEEGLTVEVITEVTDDVAEILGVRCTVARSREFEDGELVEDTFDWYAQDLKGNVWYFGEASNEIEDGEIISTEGSWKAGEEGAIPGIIMLGKPKPGLKYRQEVAADAKDRAEVISLNNTVSVPFGTFDNCLKTLETNLLEPGFKEYKYYAPGVGFIKAEEIDTEAFEELADKRQ